MIEKILERLEAEANNVITNIFASEEDDHEGIRNNAKSDAYEHAIEIVQEVAKEYGNGWIPCSERLPEEAMKDCLVTLENGAVFQAIYTCYCKEFRLYTQKGLVPFYEDNPVIAWCELPAPYQKGE